MSKQKQIFGGVFSTHTEFDAEGNVVERDEFHVRIYWELWNSGTMKKLKGAKFHVLMTIAMHVDRNAQGFPSIRRLASLLPYNKDAINKAINELIEMGLLERNQIRSEKGKFDHNTYKIKYHALDIEAKKQGKCEINKELSPCPENTATDKTGDGKTGNGKSRLKKELDFKKDPSSKKDINKQQQKDENRVVVVREKYESLFQKKLTKKQAEELITMADKHGVDVLHKIENTHEYHTKVERCRSIMASIKRAITHGDWEITRVEKKQTKPLPKAVKEQIDQKMGGTTQKVTKYTPEQIAHAKAEIERKKALLYADDEGVREAN